MGRTDVSAANSSGPEILSLEQCVEIAIHHATSVLQSANQYELTGAQILQGYGQFLPNLSAGGMYAYENGTTLYTISGQTLANQEDTNASVTVSSTLNLFNGLSDYAGLKSTLARRDAALYSLQWAKEQVALDITQTFLQLALDEQLLDIAQKNLDASNERLKLIVGQTQVGASSLPDLYRQQAQTSSDAYSVTSYDARVKSDQILLIRKLRIDPTKNYYFQAPSSANPIKSELASRPVQDLIQEVIDDRADVKSSISSVQASDWNITQARSGYFPKIDLVFGRNASGTYLTHDYANGVDVLNFSQPPLIDQLGSQVEYTVGLNLTWNLFDRFATHLNIEQARTSLENNKIALDDARFQVQADIRTAYVNYRSALTLLDSVQVGVRAAQKSFEAVQAMYQVGGASIVDVLTAQAALVQARSNFAQASINLILQDKSLKYAVGKL